MRGYGATVFFAAWPGDDRHGEPNTGRYADEDDMKRFLVFAALFPPLAFIVAMWGVLQILNWALAEPSTADYHQLILLPAAYVILLLPAMLTAQVDDVLARRCVRYRILWTALAGYMFIFAPLLGALLMGFVHGPYLMLFGIIGSVPGAICSWLAGGSKPNLA